LGAATGRDGNAFAFGFTAKVGKSFASVDILLLVVDDPLQGVLEGVRKVLLGELGRDD
jgi:hypothetical protein